MAAYVKDFEQDQKQEDVNLEYRNFPTLLETFNTLLSVPNVDNLCKSLPSLGDTLTSIGDLPNLREFAGDEEVNQLHAIINQFAELLIMTKKALRYVIKQANLQQESMEDMIENIENYENKDKFDKTEFEDSIYTLSQWISDSAIAEMSRHWTNFALICEKQHSKWQQLTSKWQQLASNARNDTANVFKTLGLMAIAGAGIIFAGVAVASFLPEALPAVRALPGILGTDKILDSKGEEVALGVLKQAGEIILGDTGKALDSKGKTLDSKGKAIALGVLKQACKIILGGTGKALDSKGEAVALDVLKQADGIILGGTGKALDSKDEVVALGVSKQADGIILGGTGKAFALGVLKQAETIAEIVKELENNKSRRRIVRAAKKIVEYLKEYQTECKKLIVSIDNYNQIKK